MLGLPIKTEVVVLFLAHASILILAVTTVHCISIGEVQGACIGLFLLILGIIWARAQYKCIQKRVEELRNGRSDRWVR